MVYKVTELDVSDKYELDIKGKVYTLPKFKNLTFDQIEGIDTAPSQLVGLRDLFANIDPALAKAVGGLASSQIEGFMADWQKDSGVELGESSASSNS